MKKFFCFIYLTCQMLPTSAQGILSLDSCRALAVANNKELLISREKINAAHYRKKEAFTNYLPKISATGGYMRNQREFSLLNDAQKSALGSVGTQVSGKTYKVAIIKQLDHASLDEIANAVAAELDKIAADNNVTIEYDITSGQNDQTILKQLSDQAIADQVDAIIPIATTAAQISALSAEDTKTPVVYAAVSDPEAASLTGIDYVTGTSDALNTSFIMDMMFTQNPDVAKVGLLYSLSEPNSTKPIADAKAYLDAKGIEYVEQTANTNDEVVAAASALIFTPTDNVIMAAELAIYEDLAKAGIPHYTGADSFVRNGAYATCGVNYTDLGAKTADLAYSAITDGMDAMEDYYLMDGGIITVNTDTAAAMSLDYSCFDSMGTVVEVTTTKD